MIQQTVYISKHKHIITGVEMGQETSDQPDNSMVEVSGLVEVTGEVGVTGGVEVTEDPVEDHDYFDQTISPNSTFSPATPFVSICLSHYIVLHEIR